MNANDAPIGRILLWEGKPAVIRDPGGWRYLQGGTMLRGRWLGDNEVEDLDTRKGYEVKRGR